MSAGSLLKSPSVIGGASLAGAGGVGVGGWQIYEEVNPTLNRQLASDGYVPKPIEVPEEAVPDNNTFKPNNWDCVKKLFNPDNGFSYNQSDTAPISTQNLVQLLNYDPSDSLSPSLIYVYYSQIKDDFVTCALLDLKESSVNEHSNKSQVHFKSEVAAKGESYGWALWSSLSSTEKTQQNYAYRLFTFKKTGDKWYVHNTFEWKVNKTMMSPSRLEDSSDFTLNIVKPMGQWKQMNLSRKVWSGIGMGKDKKVQWITCDQWAKGRQSHKHMSYVDGEIKSLCYSRK